MVESRRFDIQSTGQKSHCVNTAPPPSQCYVLIRQSDSPRPCQFAWCRGRWPDCSVHHLSAPASQSFSQSYGSILPTSLTYFLLPPEALHLGDLLRFSVRHTPAAISSPSFSRDTPPLQTQTCIRALPGLPLPRRSTRFRRLAPLARKDISSQSPSCRRQVLSRRRLRRGVCRNIDRLPFRGGWCHPVCELPRPLGPTHPGRIALPPEPFPSSVLKAPP